MTDRHLADVGLAHDRLGVSEGTGTGGAVPRVADGHVAFEVVENFLVEDLADEAHALFPADFFTIGYGNSGGLLSTVLECEQAEEGDSGGFLVRCVDADDAAFFLQAVVISLALCSIHGVECTGRGSCRAFFRPLVT